MPQLQEETGFCFDEMGILVAAGDGFDVDFVAADLLGECGEVRGRSLAVQLASGARRAGAGRPEPAEGSEDSGEASAKNGMAHGFSQQQYQKSCTPCAPIPNGNANRDSL